MRLPFNTPNLAGRVVLIAEDDLVLALDLEERLQLTGATVVGPAMSLTQALRLAQQDKRIDAAVLDVNLGGEMVYPVVDRLLEAGTPILLFTGYGEADRPEAYRHIALCQKPATADEALRLLSQALDGASGSPPPAAGAADKAGSASAATARA